MLLLVPFIHHRCVHLGATYIVCVTIVFAAVFEKLYLYKVTYGTGRRSNVRKVSYKVEVMADEALLKKNEEVYGKYLPHEGNRMELHHQGDNVSERGGEGVRSVCVRVGEVCSVDGVVMICISSTSDFALHHV